MSKFLIDRTEIAVRFNEADPLGIVWHGHYIRYFEDGREAFGNAHGLSYLDFYRNGFVVPVVKVSCDYKRSLRYGDKVIVESRYISSEAAKIIFEYTLFNPKSGEIVAKGSSMQVFLDKETSTLQLTCPSFFEEWRKKHDLI